jgi:hypothetical protein
MPKPIEIIGTLLLFFVLYLILVVIYYNYIKILEQKYPEIIKHLRGVSKKYSFRRGLRINRFIFSFRGISLKDRTLRMLFVAIVLVLAEIAILTIVFLVLIGFPSAITNLVDHLLG